MQGAAILTIAAFVTKLLSAVYRIPFQNLVGDEGFYVYQQIYPIYGIAMTLGLSGLPQFISKLVAEKEDPLEKEAVTSEVFPWIFWSSVFLWAMTLLFSRKIASLMGNDQLTPLIRVVSFTFLLVAPESFYRGNFQGNFLMVPTAVSQVFEQLLRVGVILLAAFSFVRFGLSIYEVGTLAMTGAVFGGLLACVILYHYDRKIYGISQRFHNFKLSFSADSVIRRRLLLEGGLFTIYSGLLILFQLIDSFTIVNSLSAAGFSIQAASVSKGIYDRGQPLVQLGLVVATSLSATFLPALTQAFVEKKSTDFVFSAQLYLRFTTTIALAATVGLISLLPLINFALFKDWQGLPTLAIFVLAIGAMALIQAYQSIAQSRNQLRGSLQAAVLGLLFKLVITGPLTQHYGTIGASIATILGLFVILIILMLKEEAAINAFWKKGRFGLKLLACIGIMGLFVFGLTLLIIYFWPIRLSRFMALFLSLLGVVIGAIVFIKSTISCQLLTIREWLLIPMGDKILRFKSKKAK